MGFWDTITSSFGKVVDYWGTGGLARTVIERGSDVVNNTVDKVGGVVNNTVNKAGDTLSGLASSLSLPLLVGGAAVLLIVISRK